MKLFGFSTSTDFNTDGDSWHVNYGSNGYGIMCFVVVAESIEDAKSIILSKIGEDEFDDTYLFEIPSEKGIHKIGDYFE